MKLHTKNPKDKKAVQDKVEPFESNEIVVSYKSIGINTFNCFVLNLESQLIKYWNESYQLWESPVLGFLLESNDFMMLDKNGVSLISLGEQRSRVIVDSEGFERMLHPLGKCNYLKIEPTNHILFAF